MNDLPTGVLCVDYGIFGSLTEVRFRFPFAKPLLFCLREKRLQSLYSTTERLYLIIFRGAFNLANQTGF